MNVKREIIKKSGWRSQVGESFACLSPDAISTYSWSSLLDALHKILLRIDHWPNNCNGKVYTTTLYSVCGVWAVFFVSWLLPQMMMMVMMMWWCNDDLSCLLLILQAQNRVSLFSLSHYCNKNNFFPNEHGHEMNLERRKTDSPLSS